MSQGKMSKVDKSRQNIPKLRQVVQPFRKVAQSCTKVWELHFMLTKIVQSYSKFTLFFRKIYQSCEILHKVSERFSELSENRTKLNKPTSKMPHVALDVLLNCRPLPSTLGSFHNFEATWGNFYWLGQLLTFSRVTWGLYIYFFYFFYFFLVIKPILGT